MRNSIFILFASLLLLSCKTETNSKHSNFTPPQNNTGFDEAYLVSLNDYNKIPNKETAQTLITQIKASLIKRPSIQTTKVLLDKGLEVSEKEKLGVSAVSFLAPLVKEFPKDERREEYHAKLASVLQDLGKGIPGDILIAAYKEQYKDGKYTTVLNSKQNEKIDDIDEYISKLAEDIFVNPDQFGINKVGAQKYVDACEAYILANPDNPKAPEYLYKAAEMARTLKTYPKALDLYDWLEQKYTSYKKTPTVMFLKGFMLENEIGDKEAARKMYQSFLSKFPNHELGDDVKFLLKNINKSDEEIMQMIDQPAGK